MNDSVDRVVEEWALQSGRFVLHFEGECSFVKYTARDFLVVAAWRRDGPEAVLLGYLGHLTPESDHGFQWREAEVSELRAALGLPAWVAPAAPTHGAAGPWTAVEALRLLERAEKAEAVLKVSERSARQLVSDRREANEVAERLLERAEQAEAQRNEARLRVGELEREVGRLRHQLDERNASYESIYRTAWQSEVALRNAEARARAADKVQQQAAAALQQAQRLLEAAIDQRDTAREYVAEVQERIPQDVWEATLIGREGAE